MKTQASNSDLGHDPVYEVAARFLLLEEAGKLGPADQARLKQWLEEDPRHRAAYDVAYRACAVVTDNAADLEMMTIRNVALASRGDRNPHLAWLIGAGVLTTACLGLVWMSTQGSVHVSPGPWRSVTTEATRRNQNSAMYTTAVGERLTVTLPDGSAATLDTNSVLKVAYTSLERGVELLKGQALFEVAKHKPVPFQVYAGNRRITAVGTKFDVRLDGRDVKVALLEGVVRVTTEPSKGGPPNAVPQTITMAAGEVAEAASAAPIRVATADTDKIASWRAGVLEFSDTPLDQAVAEMNRYTTRPIELADDQLATFHVNGVFKTGDPRHFAETVTEIFPLDIVSDSTGAIILKARDRR